MSEMGNLIISFRGESHYAPSALTNLLPYPNWGAAPGFCIARRWRFDLDPSPQDRPSVCYNSTAKMKRKLPILVLVFLCSALITSAQSPEFSEPWKNPNVALAIDPYEGNDINWDILATDKRVVAIIHRATIGDRVDRKYAERRDEAKKRGYKWGAYHFGKPGDPIKQADFFLDTVKPTADDLIALDLESTDGSKHMSLDDARIFIKRVKEKTGRYPLVYGNNEVSKAISEQYGADDVFAKTRLWYARFKRNVTDFPQGTWKTYALWQFSSEQNCNPANRPACLYTVPGTEYDMDIDVLNGTIDELRSKWPFDSVTVPRAVATRPGYAGVPPAFVRLCTSLMSRRDACVPRSHWKANGFFVARKISTQFVFRQKPTRA